MKKAFWGPILNMLAMLLLICSRLVSTGSFDWFAIAGTVIFLVSAGQLIYLIKTLK